MNERIKELAEQCGFKSNPDIYDRNQSFDIEKFAELIVRECVGVVEGGHFLHDQAPTALFAKECSGAIKRHFGVEECWCESCKPNTMTDMRMILCQICGNKRCPHATNHNNECTNSNEPGQKGSSWENYKV